MIQRGHEARLLADQVLPILDAVFPDEHPDADLEVPDELLCHRDARFLRYLVRYGNGEQDLVHRAARTRHGMAITCMSGASDEVSTTGSSSP
jgi:hypothetical protein